MGNESYLQIKNRLSLESVKSDDIIVVWSKDLGALAGVDVSDFQVGNSSNFEWLNATAYDFQEVVTYQGLWWMSQIAGIGTNQGNLPAEGLAWTQVNKVSGVIIPYWTAGLITEHLTLLREGASIYGLKDTVVLPYNSAVTPSADLANFELISGTSVADSLFQINNVALSGTNIELDMSDQVQKFFDTPITHSADFSITKTNESNAVKIYYTFQTSTKVVITLGVNDLMPGYPNNFEFLTKELTIFNSGIYSLRWLTRGNKYLINLSEVYMAQFIYTVTVSNGETISLPMFSGDDSLYSFNVDFDDGTGIFPVNAYGDANREHTYVAAGTYDIQITGNFDYILFADSPTSVVDVREFGPAKIDASSFEGCTNLAAISAWDEPAIFGNSLASCLEDASSLVSIDKIDNWDVSKVNTMAFMFKNCSDFVNFGQSLTPWDTSNVTDMTEMFMQTIFDNDISTWNTVSVTLMDGMFQQSLFNQDISAWNTVSVTSMTRMFANSPFFDQDISSWTMSSVVNLESMFSSNTAFDQDISNWDVSNVANMRLIFAASVFNNGGAALTWDTSNVTNMTEMFKNSTAFNQDISTWDTSNVTNMNQMFQQSVFNQDVSAWNVSSVTNMTSMFQQSVFNNGGAALTWDTSNVTNMTSLFRLSAFNQDISTWDTSNVTNMTNMLRDTPFNQDISLLDISSVTSMSNMLSNSAISQANYDALLDLLTGWPSQAVQPNVTLGATGLNYTLGGNAEAGRDKLINIHNWTIIGDTGI